MGLALDSSKHFPVNVFEFENPAVSAADPPVSGSSSSPSLADLQQNSVPLSTPLSFAQVRPEISTEICVCFVRNVQSISYQLFLKIYLFFLWGWITLHQLTRFDAREKIVFSPGFLHLNVFK